MRSHTQSVVIETNRRIITGSTSYKPLISDISVLIVCNKTGGTIKGDKKYFSLIKNNHNINTRIYVHIFILCVYIIHTYKQRESNS